MSPPALVTIGVYEFDFADRVRAVSNELRLGGPIRGHARLMRTSEGILVHSEHVAPVTLECARCLDDVRVVLRGAFDENETFRGENLSESLDSQTDIIEGLVGFELTPLTAFEVNVSHEEQRFDHAVERDANSIRVLPTLRFSPMGLLSGSVAIGYRRFTALDPRKANFSGMIASATTGVTLYERHRLDVTFNRDLTYSYDRLTPYYIATGGSVGWTWLIVQRFDVKASVSRNQMRYHGQAVPTAATDDTYFAYSAGAGYRPGRNLRLGIAGDWFRRESQTSADRTYENNRVYGTFTWGI